jgi:predicted  nucleic acid-binding Zn-ribbon protein
MQDVSPSFVQKQLLELAQHVINIIQACNDVKEVLEDEFVSVKANIKILETSITYDKHHVAADVAGVGTQLQLQEAVLQELRSGINILQGRDAQIVQETNDIFIMYTKEIEAMSKRITDNASQILAVKGTNISIQRSLKDINSKIQKVNKVLDSIINFFREVPSRRELREHATANG